jgi:dsDNA-binding SOS-regulon protein
MWMAEQKDTLNTILKSGKLHNDDTVTDENVTDIPTPKRTKAA